MSCIQKQRLLHSLQIDDPKTARVTTKRNAYRWSCRAQWCHSWALWILSHCSISSETCARHIASLSLTFSTLHLKKHETKQEEEIKTSQQSGLTKNKTRNVPDELHGAWLPFSLACFCEKGTSTGTKASKIWAKCSSVVRPPKISSAFEPARYLSLFLAWSPSCCRSSCLGYRGRVDLGRAGPGRGFPASDPRPLLQWRRVLLPKFV